VDVCGAQGAKKERLAPDAPGEYWRCTALEPETRLRVGQGIGQTETAAAIELWQHIKQRAAHRDSPPPVLSDGWGGHREALVEVYGALPPYKGRGKRPTRKKARPGWHYAQMVKLRDEHGTVTGVKLRVIYGDPTTLARTGTRTTRVERTHLTSRHMNGRLVRKTLGFSKQVVMLRAACTWEDAVYNFARSVKPLRVRVDDPARRWVPRSPAMAAGLTDHLWSIHELLTWLPVPTNSL
jgi:hypothetical protein